VTVPEAAVHKNDSLVFAQDYIGFAGQLATVQPKAETCAMQQGTHQKFRFSILPANTAHVEPSLLGSKHVHK
jgi:hypothetical protein